MLLAAAIGLVIDKFILYDDADTSAREFSANSVSANAPAG